MKDASTYTIKSYPVTGLDNKTYIEYRLCEMSGDGRLFRGFVAFGSRAFCEQALLGMQCTDEEQQAAARTKVYNASQSTLGDTITLTGAECKALWRSILNDSQRMIRAENALEKAQSTPFSDDAPIHLTPDQPDSRLASKRARQVR